MTRIALESEPAFVAVGPKCVACGMNNRGKIADAFSIHFSENVCWPANNPKAYHYFSPLKC